MNRARHKCKHPEDMHSSVLHKHDKTYTSHSHHTHTSPALLFLPDSQLTSSQPSVLSYEMPLLCISLELVADKCRLWTNTSHPFALCNVSPRLPSLLPSSSFHFFVWVCMCVCVRGNSKLQDQVSAKGQEKKSEKDWMARKCGKKYGILIEM